MVINVCCEDKPIQQKALLLTFGSDMLFTKENTKSMLKYLKFGLRIGCNCICSDYITYACTCML